MNIDQQDNKKIYYKVRAVWYGLGLLIFTLKRPREKDFFTENIKLAEIAFGNFIKQDASNVKIIKIENGMEEIIQTYSMSSSTSSTST